MSNKNPCFTKAPDVKAICDDYFKRLGLDLNYFGAGTTFKDGRFDFLVSDIAWGMHHIIEKDYAPAGYINFDEIKNEIKLPHLESNLEMGWTDGAIREAKEKFGIENLMVIFRKHDDHIQTFFFDIHNTNAHEIYINHLDIFEKFIFYFKDKAKKLIKLTSENRLVISDKHRKMAERKQFFQDNALLPTKYFLRNNGNECALSPREYECLELLSHGEKIKSASQVLNISPRTIESHIDNIKRKLCIPTLSEAIKIYWNNRII